ncbi:helix-turn-helix transcriptional regulator [Vibrio sp. PNB22_2_2]
MKLIDIKEVSRMTTLGKSTIYKHVSLKRFPAPLKVSTNNRWIESEVVEWLEKLARERA